MGSRQGSFEWLLKNAGGVAQTTLERPTPEDVLRSRLADEALRVFRALGGNHAGEPILCEKGPGAWDLELDGVGVELDEDLHFNRYRAKTLDSVVYRALPSFPREEYKRFCVVHEGACLRAGSHGGKWSNDSCDRQFGRAAPPKDLSGSGSSRWKQRAFYDFIKDLSPLVLGVPMARVAIWETLDDGDGPRTVNEALSKPRPSTGAALAALIKLRAKQ